MSQQAIIVSPDQDLVENLSRGLAGADICDQPTVLGYYPEADELRGMIDTSADPVAVVLLDLAGQSRALELIRRLRESHSEVVTLAVDQAPSRASFNGATEAGAWGYLAPPFELTLLAEHFQLQQHAPRNMPPPVPEPAVEQEPEPGDGRLISFMPVQGGNGASTIALHITDAIAHDPGPKALLLDFDFHSGTVAFRLRIKPQHTIADVLKSNHLSDQDWNSLVSVANGSHILVAPSSNVSISGEMLDRIPAVLRSARRVYPYTIVDLPDPLFSSSRHILKLSDRVYLVCTPEITSLHLARRKAQQLREAGISNERLSLLVNRVGAWGSFQPTEVQRVVGVPVAWTLDNDYPAVREATMAGGLVAENSSLGKQFHDLAAQIRARVEEDVKV